LAPPPRPIRRELARSTGAMQRAALVHTRAMGEISEVWSEAMWRTVSTLAATSLLRQAAEAQGILSPAVRQQLAEMELMYQTYMGIAAQQASERILGIAQEVCQGRIDSGGLLHRLRG
jgi:hypothetical protein